MNSTDNNSHPTADGSVSPELTLRGWAGETLGIDDGTPAVVVRRRMLVQLESADYVPPAAWREAMALLAAPASVLPALRLTPYMVEREDRLRREIDRFAAVFFDREPTARRAVWSQFVRQAEAVPPLRLRLAALEIGLDVNGAEFRKPTGEVARLTDIIAQTFSLSPPRRSRRLSELKRGLGKKPIYWEQVAVALQRDYPALARLDRVFVNDLAHFSERFAARDARAIRHRTLQRKQQQSEPQYSLWHDGEYSNWWVILLVILGLCGGLFRSCARLSTRESNRRSGWNRSSSPTPPAIEIPRTVAADEREGPR